MTSGSSPRAVGRSQLTSRWCINCEMLPAIIPPWFLLLHIRYEWVWPTLSWARMTCHCTLDMWILKVPLGCSQRLPATYSTNCHRWPDRHPEGISRRCSTFTYMWTTWYLWSLACSLLAILTWTVNNIKTSFSSWLQREAREWPIPLTSKWTLYREHSCLRGHQGVSQDLNLWCGCSRWALQ